LLRKIYTAIVKRWGTESAKQKVWNSEYQSGKWQYQREGPNNEDVEPIYGFLDRYGSGGSILDLGCGSGMTALEMKNSFGSYLGVDVSDVAVSNAQKALIKDASRAHKVKFLAADISTYKPEGHFSLILFRESIYYISPRLIRNALERYSLHLAPRGTFIVRICDRGRFKSIIDLIEANFKIEERFTPHDSTMTVLIFRQAIEKNNN